MKLKMPSKGNLSRKQKTLATLARKIKLVKELRKENVELEASARKLKNDIAALAEALRQRMEADQTVPCGDPECEVTVHLCM